MSGCIRRQHPDLVYFFYAYIGIVFKYEEAVAAFEKIMKVLDQANELIALSIEDNQLHQAKQRKGDPPPIMPFNAKIIREAEDVPPVQLPVAS